jgi:hypothetical protein
MSDIFNIKLAAKVEKNDDNKTYLTMATIA